MSPHCSRIFPFSPTFLLSDFGMSSKIFWLCSRNPMGIFSFAFQKSLLNQPVKMLGSRNICWRNSHRSNMHRHTHARAYFGHDPDLLRTGVQQDGKRQPVVALRK